MPFAYYKKLSPLQKKTYDRSDALTVVRLPEPERAMPLCSLLAASLASGKQADTELGAQRLVNHLTSMLQVSRVQVRVLEARPSKSWGELHGLYQSAPGKTPLITLWMRTAKKENIVSYKTFLRTLLHEVGHHLDYTLFRLPDSFHTEGFYKRESSLLKQVYG